MSRLHENVGVSSRAGEAARCGDCADWGSAASGGRLCYFIVTLGKSETYKETIKEKSTILPYSIHKRIHVRPQKNSIQGIHVNVNTIRLCYSYEQPGSTAANIYEYGRYGQDMRCC